MNDNTIALIVLFLVFLVGMIFGVIVTAAVDNNGVLSNRGDIAQCIEGTGRNFEGYEYCLARHDSELMEMIDNGNFFQRSGEQ